MNSIKEKKMTIIERLVNLSDEQILDQILELMPAEQYDWADDLTEEQLQLIEIGKQQIQNGEYVSSEEVHAGAKALIERKKKENKSNR